MKLKSLALICSVVAVNYATSQLSNELILDLNFNGGITDLSPSSCMLTNNGVTLTNDATGNSASAGRFPGSAYLSTVSAGLKNDLPFSMSFWIKWEQNSAGMVFSSDNVFNNYYGYWVAVGPSGEIGTHIASGLGTSSSSNRRGLITTSTLTENVWQHVVVVYKSYNDIQVYFDCELQPGTYTGSGSTMMEFSTSESRIGGQIGNNGSVSEVFLKGDLDDLKIWKRELTNAEIQTLCQNRVSTEELFQLEEKFSIYPNPSSVSTVFVSISNVNEPVSVNVFDANGRLMFKKDWSSGTDQQLDFSGVDAGVYYATFKSSQGIVTKPIYIVR